MMDQDEGNPAALFIMFALSAICDLHMGEIPKSWEGGVELGVWVTRDLH